MERNIYLSRPCLCAVMKNIIYVVVVIFMLLSIFSLIGSLVGLLGEIQLTGINLEAGDIKNYLYLILISGVSTIVFLFLGQWLKP
ncbi:MAG: hypothetical protein WC928_03345 [Patescibacteria group bacterium]|jgi:hypothetical protein